MTKEKENRVADNCIKFIIYIPPVTKKNHQQMAYNPKTRARFPIQSSAYRKYESEAVDRLFDFVLSNKKVFPIRRPVNIRAMYYVKTRRIVDIINLHSCLHDVLVEAGIIEDDNARIVVSTDGSRVRYDKDNPRTEVEITFIEDKVELDEVKKLSPHTKTEKK